MKTQQTESSHFPSFHFPLIYNPLKLNTPIAHLFGDGYRHFGR